MVEAFADRESGTPLIFTMEMTELRQEDQIMTSKYAHRGHCAAIVRMASLETPHFAPFAGGVAADCHLARSVLSLLTETREPVITTIETRTRRSAAQKHSSPVNGNSSISTATIGSYLAARLEQIGLKHHFAVAGDYNLVLLDQLLLNKNVKQVYCCNGLNCGFAAEGYARAPRAAAQSYPSNDRRLN